MQLNNLPKIVQRRKKALGRGIGSGKGKTSGRGQKGQKARGKIPAANVGAGLILYKKLPYRRGYSRHGVNGIRSPKPIVITFDQLNNLPSKTKLDVACLIDRGLVAAKDARRRGIKILNRGDLKVALTVEISVSKAAREKIEQAGGTVVEQNI
jgi:large subunit ribosomal protein L15